MRITNFTDNRYTPGNVHYCNIIFEMHCFDFKNKSPYHSFKNKKNPSFSFFYLLRRSLTDWKLDPRPEIGFKNLVAFHIDENFEASEKHF